MLTIMLPWPDKRLLPNNSHGQHWASISKVRKVAHEQAWALAKLAGKGIKISGNDDIAMRIVFGQPDNMHRDIDGMLSANKAALDGIAAALKIDDSRFNPIVLCREHDTEKVGYVRVIIGV